jgi:hypothetical protein
VDIKGKKSRKSIVFSKSRGNIFQKFCINAGTLRSNITVGTYVRGMVVNSEGLICKLNLRTYLQLESQLELKTKKAVSKNCSPP